MDQGIKVHHKVDTVLNADSAEFCPYSGQEIALLCGTYFLQEDSNPEVTTEDAATNCPTQFPSKPQTRAGGVSVYAATGHGSELSLCQKSQVDIGGVLDIKWPGSRSQEKSLFGIVDSNGFFQIYNLQSLDDSPSHVAKVELSESSLGLSLCWDGGRDRLSSKAVCSDSAGCLSVIITDSSSCSLSSRWKAHDYEAWITCFHGFDSNIVYSGGDDCLLKGWDLRDTTKPTFVSKRHSMGVCSMESHPFNDAIYATGSYDEELLVWDRRQQKRPLSNISLGGGIWRIKWDPFVGHYILTASMYNGTHIVKADYSAGSSTIVAEHNDHNLAYGADWCRLNTDLQKHVEPCKDENDTCDLKNVLISTCSFYDHSLHLWEWSSSAV